MPLKSEIEELPHLNLTSMIDILLVLVMFFLVSSKFTESDESDESQRQAIDVELPTATPLKVKTMSRPPDPLVIRVDQSGKVAIKNDMLSLEQLQEKLKEAKKNYSEQSVLISADREGLYQSVVDVLDACRLSDISHLSLAYKPKVPPEP